MNKIGQQTTDNRQQTLSVPIKKLMVHGSWLIVLCSLFSVLSSCSVNKNTSSLRNLSANHIIREVEDNRFEFDNLEAKLGIKVKGDNNIGLKGQLKMQNDSVIWISVSLKLGIEVGRIMITEDSLKFINRSNRTYLTASLNNVSEILPIDASIRFLQDILVGNDSKLKRGDKYKAIAENNRYKLVSNNNEIMTRDIWVTPKTFKISQYDIRLLEDDKNKISLLYDNFQEINGRLLPTKITIVANDNFGIDLEIDYSEIKVGEKSDFPFNISKKYDRINLW